MFTLQHSNPEKRKQNRKGKKKLDSLTSLALCPGPLQLVQGLARYSYFFLAIRCTDDPRLHTALQLLVGI